ncbi:unnamed protein product [Notodromas monacha]|uniref:Uncharacterized protein n=1 Tax=Notodromas monacha TaxID=399045 RepID=A0A7R9BLV1_9CRUS|nr:unnamed protein product [Notodromas monacha]CAG0917878.1 unnamed protein product [Notodromas monacha]
MVLLFSACSWKTARVVLFYLLINIGNLPGSETGKVVQHPMDKSRQADKCTTTDKKKPIKYHDDSFLHSVGLPTRQDTNAMIDMLIAQEQSKLKTVTPAATGCRSKRNINTSAMTIIRPIITALPAHLYPPLPTMSRPVPRPPAILAQFPPPPPMNKPMTRPPKFIPMAHGEIITEPPPAPGGDQISSSQPSSSAQFTVATVTTQTNPAEGFPISTQPVGQVTNPTSAQITQLPGVTTNRITTQPPLPVAISSNPFQWTTSSAKPFSLLSTTGIQSVSPTGSSTQTGQATGTNTTPAQTTSRNPGNETPPGDPAVSFETWLEQRPLRSRLG